MNKKTKTLLFFAAISVLLLIACFKDVSAATTQTKRNELTIALDTVGGTSTTAANNIINYMKNYHYNSLRIYMGWCSSFWTGNVNSPMNTNTQTFIDQLCNLCKQNGFTVTCAVSMQVTPWKTAYPNEIQVGPKGEQNSQGNWVCPTGPSFQTFTKNLVKILVNIMEKYATPRISVDEIVFVTGGGRPTFYSQSMRNLYQQRTGKTIPTFTSTSGSYSTEQRAFIEFAKGTIRDFYIMARNTAKTENPSTIYQALIDTYWVYPRTSYDTEPWDYYATTNFDELAYEWFYAIQNSNWAGITDGLQRIIDLNPTAKHYFIYGTSTMTTTANMRQAVQIAMNQNYDGVSLYEYAKSKNNPFDVSDIVYAGSPSPSPSPTPLPTPSPPPASSFLFQDGFESGDFDLWSEISTSSGDRVATANYEPHDGYYAARFSTNGEQSGSEDACLSKYIDMPNVSARGYFRFASTRYTGSQILSDNSDRLYLIKFSNGAESLAMAGIRKEGGVEKWILYAAGTYKTAAQAVSANRWYCVELQFDETLGLVNMYVDGIKLLQIAVFGDNNSSADRVDFGIISATNVQNRLTVYGDCFRATNMYNGIEVQ